MEKLKGIIERITFQNEENGYTVAKLKADNAKRYDDLITITGNIASVNVGETVLLEGEWKKHPKYGNQFEVYNYTQILPATVEGIKKYLGSGLIKGIGPKFAERIVKEFGVNTIDIIENDIEQLYKVPGIGTKRVEMIKRAWAEQQDIKEVMLFLQSHNVSTTFAVKIYKTYQKDSIRIVQENPYRLADDIWGIGFKTADKIASNLGIPETSERRLSAGLKYILSQAVEDGHTYLPKEELLKKGLEILVKPDSQRVRKQEEREDSVIGNRLSVIGNQLSVIGNRLSVIGGQSEIFNPQSTSKNKNDLMTNELMSLLSSALDSLISRAEVIQDNDKIYLPLFYHCETNVSKKLISLTAKQKPIIKENSLFQTTDGNEWQIFTFREDDKKYSTSKNEFDIDEKISYLEKKHNIEFTNKQRDAIRKVLRFHLDKRKASPFNSLINGGDSRVLVITGGPGTGKTTVTIGIVELAEMHNLNVALCAPTGRASKKLSESSGRVAKTIHRLLEFSPSDNTFKYNQDRYLPADIVIVDEVSMVDIVLMNSLLKAISPQTSIVLIGDKDQLPSVGAGNVLKDIIDSKSIEVIELDEIFRQAQDSTIVINAHRINKGEFPYLKPIKYEDFYFIELDEPVEIAKTIVELCSTRLPAHYKFDPFDDIQVITPMYRGEIGADKLNILLQERLNPISLTGNESKVEVKRKGESLRVGDKVMQIKNNYNKMVFNGDIGRIKEIDKELQQVTISYYDADVVYEFYELDEIVLAYAITVHKAQGSEYKAVVMPISTQHYVMLQRNLLYTAITRAKELVVLVGTKKAISIAVNNNKIEERYSGLKERLNI